eukprot:6356797-Ditylum_brightwellii.AAC.1
MSWYWMSCYKNLPTASSAMLSARSDSNKSRLLCACPFPSHNNCVSVAITHPKYPRGPLAP